jgi:hypothetical protein
MRLLLEQLYQILRLIGAPWARALNAALWCGTATAAVSSEVKRLLSTLVGWQNEKLNRRGTLFGVSLLPDLRKWHVTLGTFVAILPVLKQMRKQRVGRVTSECVGVKYRMQV